jgi:hypothetical protein
MIRSVALVLALLVAATPAIGAVCEMGCEQPPASSPCHKASPPQGGTALQSAPHGCGHAHTSGSPAFLTSAANRDSVGISFPAAPVSFLPAMVHKARVASTASLHGPPGLSGRRTSAHRTVLRI